MHILIGSTTNAGNKPPRNHLYTVTPVVTKLAHMFTENSILCNKSFKMSFLLQPIIWVNIAND